MKTSPLDRYEIFGLIMLATISFLFRIARCFKKIISTFLLYTLALVYLLEEWFLKYFASAGTLIAVLLVVGFAGHADAGGTMNEFITSVFITIVVYAVLTVLYIYLRRKELK